MGELDQALAGEGCSAWECEKMLRGSSMANGLRDFER